MTSRHSSLKMGEKMSTPFFHFRGIPVFSIFFRKSVHTFGNSDFIFQNFGKIPKICVRRLLWAKTCGSEILNFAFFQQNFDFSKNFAAKIFEKSKFRGGEHDDFRLSHYLTSNTHQISIFHQNHPTLVPKCSVRLFLMISENLNFRNFSTGENSHTLRQLLHKICFAESFCGRKAKYFSKT